MSWPSAQSILLPQPVDSVSLPPVVINTRPIERAAPLTRHLQAAGLTVVDMPMLALQRRAVTAKDMTLMRQWLAGEYQALVIVSPTAAAAGLAVWQTLARKHKAQSSINEQPEIVFETLDVPSPLIAVGDATAAVLNNVKLDIARYQVRQPVIANNEGMLAMPEIESLRAGDKLLVWRGRGGRQLLVDSLQARGVHIDSIAWYERVMPTDATVQYRQWLKLFSMQKAMQPIMPLQPPKPIVIISSGTAFEHWQKVVNQAQALDAQLTSAANIATSLDNSAPFKLSDFAYVVLGARLAHMLAEQQLSYWQVADLAPETILAAIKQGHWFSPH